MAGPVPCRVVVPNQPNQRRSCVVPQLHRQWGGCKGEREEGAMTTLISRTTLIVETIRAEDGGCLGYLLIDAPSGTGLAVDPRLDLVDEFLDTARARGVGIAYVLDTHTHADHLSGVRRLAHATGATVIAHAASTLAYPVHRVAS